MMGSTERIEAYCGCVYVLTTGCSSPEKSIDVQVRCARHGGDAAPQLQLTVPTWQSEAFGAYVEVVAPYIEAQVRRLVELELALQDIAMVQVLARHPWWLHHLAQQPEWQAYVLALRASRPA